MDLFNSIWQNSDQQFKVKKFGFNAATSSTKEGCWAHGGPVNWLAAATQLKVSSASTADTAAGTGMRTMLIQGLDAGYNRIEETVSLSGQTDFLTTKSFLRVFRLVGLSFGTGGTNAGIVYVYTGADTDGTPSVSTTVYSTIPLGEGQTLQAMYTVPAGYTAYIVDSLVSSFGNTNVAITARLETREFGRSGWNTRDKVLVGRTSVAFPHTIPLAIPEKTDIMITGTSSGADGDMSGAFDMICIRNT